MLVDSGKALTAQVLSGLSPPENLQFCLYTNSVTWTHATVIGNLTEAAWTGYARVTVPLAGWMLIGSDAALDIIYQATALANFTNSTGSTVTANGFFVMGVTSGSLYGGYAFSTALAITAGQTVSTYPQLSVNTLLP
jgi:hypothetical protein